MLIFFSVHYKQVTGVLSILYFKFHFHDSLIFSLSFVKSLIYY